MKTVLIEAKLCPSCGKLMPSGALAGLCPTCLLSQGAATGGSEGAGAGAAPFQPPAIADIAKLFPQLEILGLLGAGGMGAVYKARQPALDRFVALKILPATNASGVNFAERFNREARALARLSHPNIVAVHEFGQAGELSFFIMEFVDGANLRQLCRSARVSPREALQIIPQICDALQYAHDEGVVHRDIKPENVLVDRKGRVKIADFGLAKILGYDAEAARLTAEGQIMGTPHYMAPEQVERPLSVDHRADIYSLGVVFYEMLTGDLPLGKFAPPSRKVEVDVRLDEVVLRALENDPERRYQRASEVKSRVENITSGPIPASPAHGLRPKPSSRRYLRWAGFPVVAEYDGEREVSWNGTLSSVAAAFFFLFLGFVLVRLITGSSNHPGTLPICAMMAVFTVLAGVRRTLNQPAESELPRTPSGTVVLPPKRRWNWQYLALAGITAFAVGWTLFSIHWLGPQIRKWTGRPLRVAQVATRDAQSGAFVVKLPERGTVEILALSDPGAAPNQWWRPDGLPVTDATYEVVGLGESVSSTPIQQKDLILQHHDLPGGASSLDVEIEPSGGYSSGGEVLQQGKPLAGAQPYRIAFPEKARSATLRVGLGLAPWRTVATQNADGHHGTQTRVHNEPNWTVEFIHEVAEVGGRPQITYVFGPNDRGWTHRIVAVDTNDVEHSAFRGTSTPVEKMTMLTATFHEVPLEALKEFRVQVRPVHWVEFRGIALNPSKPLPAPQPLRFSEVVEHRFDALIDFDTGKTEDFPAGKPGRQFFGGLGEEMLWAQENGFDGAAGVGELEVLNTTFAPVTDNDWDRLTPQQVMDSVLQNRFAPRRLKPTANAGSGRTFSYETREGGFGLLQFITCEEGNPEITVRIKRVERPGMPMPAPAQPSPQSRTRWNPRPGSNFMELVAISVSGGAPDEWWRPDGSAARGLSAAVLSSSRLTAADAQSFDLLFRLKAVPLPSATPVFEFTRAIRSAVGGEVCFDEGREEGLLPVQVVWPKSVKTDSGRIGIPVADWHTIGSYEPSTRSYSRTRTGDDPRWEFHFQSAGDSPKGAALTVVFGAEHPNWNLRVIATRSRETNVVGLTDAAFSTDSTRTRTYAFPGVALAEVMNFQVQAQPLQWVDIEDFPLTPRDETDGECSANQFERAVELQLAGRIDFDTGRTTSSGQDSAGDRATENPEMTGFDAEFHADAVRLQGMTCVSLAPSDWLLVTPESLSLILREKGSNLTELALANRELPITAGYRTREGGVGILQILEFTPTRDAVTLRFKRPK